MANKTNSRVWWTISIFLVILTGFAQARTVIVGPGTSYDFGSIQAGIDAAVDEDTVLVAPGEYVITEPITFRGKAITVQSEAGPNQTTIRMGTPSDPNRGSVVVFENNETDASVLDGFTITGGRGCRLWDPLDSEFDWSGGGICFDASSGTVRNCAIVQNRVEKRGGGVYCAYSCSPRLIDCIIADNSSTESGGGLIAQLGPSLTLTNCILRGNSTGSCGGGVAGWDGSLTLTDCAIVSNTAQRYGGGIYWAHGSGTVTNSVTARNTAAQGGGGLCLYYSGFTVSNCTIWGNSAGDELGGGGLGYYFGSSSTTITNCIMWGNTASMGPEISLMGGIKLSVAYSNVAEGQAGAYVGSDSTLDWAEGNIDADPYFADPDNGNYRLKSQAGRWDANSQTWIQDDVTSPCIDAGDPMNPIGWESFPNGGFVNMGAYGGTAEASKSYFGEPICETIVAGDINGDCQVNRADLEIMALHWTDDEPLPLP